MRSERPEPARSRQRRPHRPRRSSTPLLAVATLLLVVGCGGPTPNGANDDPATQSTSAAASATPAADDARLVRTLVPERGTLQASRSASANVRALRDATVASGASSRVVEILARPGDLVEARELVVRLDDDQAAIQADAARLSVQQAEIDLARARRSSDEGADQARASLQAARSNVANLRDQVGEVRALVTAGGAARSDLNTLQTQLEQAEASLIQAQDAVARAERSEGEDLALLELALQQARLQAAQAQDALDETRIRAPFAGEIAELFLETGEFAGAGQPAFRLVSADEREAVFDVPPEDARFLLEQGSVTLRYAGRELEAPLVGSSRPAQQPRSIQLTARLAGDDARAVPTGALAEVRYTVDLAEGLLVPAGAIASESGATWLYVVDDGVASRVPVDVLAEASATAVVDGVDPEAVVIHPRPLDVRVGTRVRSEP